MRWWRGEEGGGGDGFSVKAVGLRGDCSWCGAYCTKRACAESMSACALVKEYALVAGRGGREATWGLLLGVCFARI
jgi:hypothetical protein